MNTKYMTCKYCGQKQPCDADAVCLGCWIINYEWDGGKIIDPAKKKVMKTVPIVNFDGKSRASRVIASIGQAGKWTNNQKESKCQA